MGYDITKKDYSKKENQIGCGYCSKEKVCLKREQKINKAKAGCEDYRNYSETTKTNL